MKPKHITEIMVTTAPDAEGQACVLLTVGNTRTALVGMFAPEEALRLGTALVTEATQAMQMRMGLVEGVTLQ